MTTDQCSALEVLYQESNVKITKNRWNALPKFFENWGESSIACAEYSASKVHVDFDLLTGPERFWAILSF